MTEDMEEPELIVERVERNLINDLIQSLDPLAVINVDEADKKRRYRLAARRVVPAMHRYNELVRTNHVYRTFQQWKEQSVMAINVGKARPQESDRMVEITMELAEALDPTKCSGFSAGDFDVRLLRDDQKEVLNRAAEFVAKISKIPSRRT